MNSQLAPWWWSVCTRRVSLIGIQMTFVDSLHINRWLCGDNVQHIVETMMHTHTHIQTCTHLVCIYIFFFPKAVRGTFINLSISDEGRQSLSGVWAGIPEQMSLHSHTVWSCNNKTKPGWLCCCCCRKVCKQKLLLFCSPPTAPILQACYQLSFFTNLDEVTRVVRMWEMNAFLKEREMERWNCI